MDTVALEVGYGEVDDVGVCESDLLHHVSCLRRDRELLLNSLGGLHFDWHALELVLVAIVALANAVTV